MRTAILIGIVVGVALGLVYAWLIAPVEFRTADPVHVEARYREAWVIMSAEAYVAGGDWERTQARLNGLGDPNLPQTVAALFERVSVNGPNPQARARPPGRSTRGAHCRDGRLFVHPHGHPHAQAGARQRHTHACAGRHSCPDTHGFLPNAHADRDAGARICSRQ